MKNRKLFIGTTGILCIVFCLFLPFYFGLQFLLPKLMPQETSSQVSEDILTPDECSPLEAWKLCEDALKSIGSFSSQSEGTVDTQILFFNYQQQISNRRVVTDKTVFLQSMNTGALLNAGLQQYFDGSKAYLRPCQLVGSNHFSWAETPSVVSMSAYYDAFGPVTDGLSPFLLNERTLVTAFYLYENDGVYSFSFELSPESAIHYARSMRTASQLERDPVFTSVEITLDMDAEFRPIRMEYEEEYTIYMDLIGDTACKSKYVETFLYEEEVLEEREFFDRFASLEASNEIPLLSTGYNFLFSLFGNTNTYEGTLTLSGKEIPLTVSLDTNDKSIFAMGEGFSLVYCDQQYYFHFADNKLSSDAEAFNSKIGPLASIGGSNGQRIRAGSPADSFMDNVNVKTEQGKLIVSSDSDGLSFSVTMNTTTMLVENLSVTISAGGEIGTLSLVQSDSWGEKPSLQGYTGITHTLDSLDILLELAYQPNTYYHVQIKGEQTLAANVSLTLGDDLRLNAELLDERLPLELFYRGETLSAVYNDITLSGALSEFEALLSLFGGETSLPVTAAAPIPGIDSLSDVIISAEGSNLVLNFGPQYSQKLTLCGDRCIFEDGSSTVYITKTGYGDQAVAEAPATKHNVAASDLYAFLEGSVYPGLLGAETIYATLDVVSPQGSFDVDAIVSMSPEMTLRLDTDLNGDPIRLYYKEDTLYFCHEVFKAFLPADQLDLLSQVGSGNNGGTPAETPNAGDQLQSIQVESHQIKLVFGSQTLYLTKESFRLVGEDTTIRSTKLRGEDNSVFIDVPAKKTCIDLADLAYKFSCLEDQTRFAFTGNYSDDLVAAVISRLDILLTEDGELSQLAAEAIVSNTISQLVKIFYDSESLYLDLGGLKLYALMEEFRDQPGALLSELDATGSGEAPNLLQILSGLKSVTYSDNTLMVTTEDAVFSINWLGDEVNLIRYKSGKAQLLLVKCEERPIAMPLKESYTDITPLSGLIKTAANTITSQSIRFDGNFNFKIFSYTLENIQASGVLSTKDGSLSADLTFTVPYVPGVSSSNIPTVHEHKKLQDCNIENHVLILDEKIFITREIRCLYGRTGSVVVVLTEKRFVTFDQFLSDPTETFNFLLNLEKDLPDEDIPEPEPEPDVTDPDPIFSQSPIKEAYKEDEYFVLELSPHYLPNSKDDLVFKVYTDGQYINKMHAISHISIFTIEGSVDIYEHGMAKIDPPEKDALKEYLPLQD